MKGPSLSQRQTVRSPQPTAVLPTRATRNSTFGLSSVAFAGSVRAIAAFGVIATKLLRLISAAPLFVMGGGVVESAEPA